MGVEAPGTFHFVFGNGRHDNSCGGKFGGVSQFTLFGALAISWLVVCRANDIAVDSRSSQLPILWSKRIAKKSFGKEIKWYTAPWTHEVSRGKPRMSVTLCRFLYFSAKFILRWLATSYSVLFAAVPAVLTV